MTKTYLLCLANSKKHGERCIAGIQLVPNDKSQFHPVKTNGNPKWLRPVTDDEHGRVPAGLVQDIAVGDIIEMNCLRPCPVAYQSENIYFEQKSLRVIRPAKLSEKHLYQLVEDDGYFVFDNSGPCLTDEEISHVTRSLILIKTEKAKPFFSTPYNTRPRFRFLYKKNWYNFPITDVNFIDRMQDDPGLLQEQGGFFLTVSLSIRFEGKYWKLAAGILTVRPSNNDVA